MVAIRFKVSQQRADGFMLLARNGSVRTLKNEIYVCNEKALQALGSAQHPLRKSFSARGLERNWCPARFIPSEKTKRTELIDPREPLCDPTTPKSFAFFAPSRLCAR